MPARLPPPARLQAVLAEQRQRRCRRSAAIPRLPLLAVGDATAAKARAAGFTAVHSAGRDAEALAVADRAALRSRRPRRCWWPASSDRRGASSAALRAAGFRVAHRAVYAARPVAALPEPALAALASDGVAAALFFSPATARAFVALAASLPTETFANVQSLAISKPAAAALTPLPWLRIRVASAPTQDDLLGLLP